MVMLFPFPTRLAVTLECGNGAGSPTGMVCGHVCSEHAVVRTPTAPAHSCCQLDPRRPRRRCCYMSVNCKNESRWRVLPATEQDLALALDLPGWCRLCGLHRSTPSSLWGRGVRGLLRAVWRTVKQNCCFCLYSDCENECGHL